MAAGKRRPKLTCLRTGAFSEKDVTRIVEPRNTGDHACSFKMRENRLKNRETLIVFLKEEYFGNCRR